MLGGWTRILLFALLIPLSGCADAPPGADEARDDGLGLSATETTGVIRGVVLDEAVRPIEGAMVSLQNGKQTVSNAEGAFGFSELEPGTYFLSVSHARFGDMQSSTTVTAGVDTPPMVRVQMQSLNLPDPYVETVQINVFLDASACALTCVSCCGFLTNEDTTATYEGEFFGAVEGTQYIQVFTSWTATQPTGPGGDIRSRLYDSEGTFVASRNDRGMSPVIQEFREDEDVQGAVGPLELRGAIWAWGEPQGIGATVQQTYEVIAVATVYFAPPEGYRFDVDGEPTPPA